MLRPLRIGITIGLRSEAEPLWINGIKQNAVFLAGALRRCPDVASVVLVNTTDVPITPALPWDQARWPTVSFEQAKDGLDVLIELGGQIDENRTNYLINCGCKLVSYCCGVEYINATQTILFHRSPNQGGAFVNQHYDDIWMIPQIEPINRGYFEILRRRQARVVPFVWSPVFLEERGHALPHGGRCQPRGGQGRRLTVMEPNIDVVKFCLYPILIAEQAYRTRPEAIEKLLVANAEKMAQENHFFISLMHQLDLVNNHKAVFVGRYDTPYFLAEHTDIVISHQWENPLNYFYLEVCWHGYPLVHNASLCPDLGFYYPGHDLQLGAEQVLKAAEMGADALAQYQADQRQRIGRFLCDDASVVKTYHDLLSSLFSNS